MGRWRWGGGGGGGKNEEERREEGRDKGWMRREGGGRDEGGGGGKEVWRGRKVEREESGEGGDIICQKKFQLTKTFSKPLSKICLELRMYRKVPPTPSS